MGRVIFHIDFDYFYAQCEELRKPSLKEKPVVVCVYSARGGDSGAVSTANYKAREYGVKSGMPIKFAKERLREVPDAVFLPVDHAYYDTISEQAMNIVRSYADKFEQGGDDEAYLDVTERVDFESAEEYARKIKVSLRKSLNLSSSIGVGPNKLIAKIASDYRKPDGLTIIKPDQVQAFISDMEVRKIIGVGKKTEARLNEMGVKTVKDLAEMSIYALVKEFGKKTGTYLYNASRGIDEEPVRESEAIMQISRITTLKKNTNSVQEMLVDLESLCKEVHQEAIKQGFSFKNIGIMLVLDDLSVRSKSRSLRSPSTNLNEFIKVARSLLEEAVTKDIMIRRLGVKLSELASSRGQETLQKFIEEQ